MASILHFITLELRLYNNYSNVLNIQFVSHCKNDRHCIGGSMGSIKIPYALKGNEPVYIDSVERGLACDCQCPICGEPLIARKGEVNTPHFSHKAKPKCKSETVLQYLGKQFLYRRIQESINSKTKLDFEWFCRTHNRNHDGDLMHRAASVRIDSELGNITPDITTYSKKGNPRIAIEVSVSSPINPEIVEYCCAKDIYLFQLNLKKGSDLHQILHGKLFFKRLYNDCPM